MEGIYALANPPKTESGLTMNYEFNLSGMSTQLIGRKFNTFPMIEDAPKLTEVDEFSWGKVAKNALIGTAAAVGLIALGVAIIVTAPASIPAILVGTMAGAAIGGGLFAGFATAKVTVHDITNKVNTSLDEFGLYLMSMTVKGMEIGAQVGSMIGGAVDTYKMIKVFPELLTTMTNLFSSVSSQLGNVAVLANGEAAYAVAVGAVAVPYGVSMEIAVKLGDNLAKMTSESGVKRAAKTGTGEYSEVGGHHIHAKAAFDGDINYDLNKGFSISQDFMKKNGWNHRDMTAKQRQLFKELYESGRPNTLEEHTRIAKEALKAGGATEEEASELINQSLQNLAEQGVTQPTRIPWYSK